MHNLPKEDSEVRSELPDIRLWQEGRPYTEDSVIVTPENLRWGMLVMPDNSRGVLRTRINSFLRYTATGVMNSPTGVREERTGLRFGRICVMKDSEARTDKLFRSGMVYVGQDSGRNAIIYAIIEPEYGNGGNLFPNPNTWALPVYQLYQDPVFKMPDGTPKSYYVSGVRTARDPEIRQVMMDHDDWSRTDEQLYQERYIRYKEQKHIQSPGSSVRQGFDPRKFLERFSD